MSIFCIIFTYLILTKKQMEDMTEEELQALLDEENNYINHWRNSLTQEQIDSI